MILWTREWEVMVKHLVCSASTSCSGVPLDHAAESFVELRVARYLHFAVFRFIAMVGVLVILLVVLHGPYGSAIGKVVTGGVQESRAGGELIVH
jgi:hypothetical protein